MLQQVQKKSQVKNLYQGGLVLPKVSSPKIGQNWTRFGFCINLHKAQRFAKGSRSLGSITWTLERTAGCTRFPWTLTGVSPLMGLTPSNTQEQLFDFRNIMVAKAWISLAVTSTKPGSHLSGWAQMMVLLTNEGALVAQKEHLKRMLGTETPGISCFAFLAFSEYT